MTPTIDPDLDKLLDVVERFDGDWERYLSPWELDFVESMQEVPRAYLSNSQRMKCDEIRERLEARGA